MNMEFDPNGVGVDNGNYYGLPFTVDDARLVLVEVPWDVTVSYGEGAADAPMSVRRASTQLDLYDSQYPDAWRAGIAAVPAGGALREESRRWREEAREVIGALERGESLKSVMPAVGRINAACEHMNGTVYDTCSRLLAEGKIVGLVGGDHSTPYGLVKALAGRDTDFGILHFDAHCDLREAYEGFEYSHASIMYNILRDVPQVSRIVEVGVRDYCDSEAAMAAASPRIAMFNGVELARRSFEGESWASQCDRIIGSLPGTVYVSFDIDALDVQYCPHTGTPVAGGLTFDRAVYLLKRLCDSGKRIIGFDMVEVVPSHDAPIDQMVGARILYKLCLMTLAAEIRRG